MKSWRCKKQVKKNRSRPLVPQPSAYSHPGAPTLPHAVARVQTALHHALPGVGALRQVALGGPKGVFPRCWRKMTKMPFKIPIRNDSSAP
jgi:hypothetical protein